MKPLAPALLATFAALVTACGTGPTSTAPKPPAAKPRVASPETQAERRKLIENELSPFISKVEAQGNHARATVLPAFYALDFETKRQYAAVVYVWAFDVHEDDTPTDRRKARFLYDAQSGRQSGRYRVAFGGLRMELHHDLPSSRSTTQQPRTCSPGCRQWASTSASVQSAS